MEWAPQSLKMSLTRFSHRLSNAAADPGMSALRSVGLLDVLPGTPAGPSVALAEKPPDGALYPWPSAPPRHGTL